MEPNTFRSFMIDALEKSANEAGLQFIDQPGRLTSYLAPFLLGSFLTTIAHSNFSINDVCGIFNCYSTILK